VTRAPALVLRAHIASAQLLVDVAIARSDLIASHENASAVYARALEAATLYYQHQHFDELYESVPNDVTVLQHSGTTPNRHCCHHLNIVGVCAIQLQSQYEIKFVMLDF
jgi:hypothetical protein